MANEHLILCGSARLTSRKPVWRKAKPVRLDLNRQTGNINLRISDITEKLTANLRDVELDLLDIAAYVYCADQATTRGGTTSIDYGLAWYRDFRFEVPVRCPEFWSSPEVSGDLCRCLNDLSGDNFEFVFSPITSAPPLPTYFEYGQEAMTPVDSVMLFSGGLDSFGGAVREALGQNRKVVLVSHRPVTKIAKRQRELVADIAKNVSERRLAPIHVPVLVNKAKELNREYTQRTRSFLYACVASVVARLFGLKSIRFYENGVTSLNLPISPQVVSTRATRTTHPRVLAGFASLFSRVYEDGFGVENPFFWMTKAEILRVIKSEGYSRLCAFTSSCAHTWEMTRMHTHCGECTQCVERRLVALAAGLGDDEDPPEMYRTDVLRGERDAEGRILVESFAEVLNRIEKIDTPTAFSVEFPELARVINHIQGRADNAAQAIFELYRRHSREVLGALDAAGQAAIPEMRKGELPKTCLLSIVFSGARQIKDALPDAAPPSKPAPSGAADDANGQPELNKSAFSLRWKGRKPLEIGNRKEFHLLDALLTGANRYLAHTDLAQKLGGDELDQIGHVKSRLTKLLKDNGYADLAKGIRTQKGHYGLFLA